MFQVLQGGAYTSRSLIASAQRCLNLYVEATRQTAGEPIPTAHYCTPGLTLQASIGTAGCRGLYTAFNGVLYACYGQQILSLSATNVWTQIGVLAPSDPTDSTNRSTPVSMCDNGILLLIVDGSVDGWFIDVTVPLSTQSVTQINRGINTGWLGSDIVAYQDTFFLFNQPGTANFYISLSDITATKLTAAFSVYTADLTVPTKAFAYTAGDVLTLTGTGGAQVIINTVDATGKITGYGVTAGGAVNVQPTNPVPGTGGSGNNAMFDLTYETNIGGFDPLDYAGMTGQANLLVAALSVHRNLLLIGTTSFEYWVNSGGDGTAVGSFPFQIYPQAFGNWGCMAKYSVAVLQNSAFWLSQDKFGNGVIMSAQALTAKRISTYAIEYAIAQYSNITDAVGMAYNELGHAFYLLTFPSANNDRGATWVYDLSTDEWSERCYIDVNGIEYRHLANAMAGAYNQVYVGDWSNGNCYTFDTHNYTDNGMPIKRLRSFPHEIDLQANRRVMYHQLIAQVQVGSAGPASSSIATIVNTPFIAPDNTLLQNYSNINAMGASFTSIDANNMVILNDAAVAQVSGDVLYQVNVTLPPAQPDYSVSFTMKPTGYTVVPPSGDQMYIIGRANVAGQGYLAGIISDGLQYQLELTVMGGISYYVPMGVITSGVYQITLSMQSDGITVAAYRSQDGFSLTATGWVGSPAIALSIADMTYTTVGRILMGGAWDVITTLVNGLSGQQSVAGLGTLGVNVVSANNANAIITGVSILAAIHTPSVLIVNAPVTTAITGVASAASIGVLGASISAINVSIGLTGRVIIAGIGQLIAQAVGGGVIQTTLPSELASSAIGSLTVSKINIASLPGLSSTGSVGVLSRTASANVTLLGQFATATSTGVTVTTVNATESPSGTTLNSTSGFIDASPTPGTAGAGNIVTLTSSGVIDVNGVMVPATASVTTIAYYGHTVFQLNSAGNWYGPVTATSPGTLLPNSSSVNASPVPVITISQTNFLISTASSPSQFVGTVQVTVGGVNNSINMTLSGSSAGSFSWSSSGTQTTINTSNGTASLYTIAGAILPLSPPAYNITVTAIILP